MSRIWLSPWGIVLIRAARDGRCASAANFGTGMFLGHWLGVISWALNPIAKIYFELKTFFPNPAGWLKQKFPESRRPVEERLSEKRTSIQTSVGKKRNRGNELSEKSVSMYVVTDITCIYPEVCSTQKDQKHGSATQRCDWSRFEKIPGRSAEFAKKWHVNSFVFVFLCLYLCKMFE